MAVHRIAPEPASLAAGIREVAGSGDLFWMLVAREIRTRYRQTALGVAWVVLQPLAPALIFAAVFGSFARLPSGGVPYFLFALSGLIVFGMFSNAVSRASGTFLRDSQLISKVYFPRVLLPVAAGIASAFDFIVGFVLVVVLMVGAGIVPSMTLLIAPLIALEALVLGLALGTMLAALSAHFRDFTIAVPFALQVGLYASPVLYSSELVPSDLRILYAMNPMASITEAFRASLLGSTAPSVGELAVAVAVGLGVVVASVMIYRRAARDLTDVL